MHAFRIIHVHSAAHKTNTFSCRLYSIEIVFFVCLEHSSLVSFVPFSRKEKTHSTNELITCVFAH